MSLRVCAIVATFIVSVHRSVSPARRPCRGEGGLRCGEMAARGGRRASERLLRVPATVGAREEERGRPALRVRRK